MWLCNRNDCRHETVITPDKYDGFKVEKFLTNDWSDGEKQREVPQVTRTAPPMVNGEGSRRNRKRPRRVR